MAILPQIENPITTPEELNPVMLPSKTYKISDRIATTFSKISAPSGSKEEIDSISIYDAMDYDASLDIKGNTQQVQLEGKNLFDCYSYPQSRTSNGVTCTNNMDGSFTLNGTCNADNTSFLLGSVSFIRDLVNNGDVTHTAYYLSGNCTKGPSSSARTVIRLNYDTGTSLMIPLQELKEQLVISRTHPKDSRTTSWSWAIVLGNGDVFDNFTLKYQVEQGSTSTSWEPYCGGQPAPNPEYPQDIKVITNSILIKHTGKNLLDTTKMIQFTPTLANWASLDGVERFYNATNIAQSELYYDLKPNINYTFSVYKHNNISLTNQTPFQLVNQNGNLVAGATLTNLKVSFTVNEATRVYPRISVAQSNIPTQCIVQLEEGTIATFYEPYKENEYQLDLGNIELCKIGNYQDILFKNEIGDMNYNQGLEAGAWYKKKVINKYTLTGTETFYSTGVDNIYYSPDIANYARTDNKPFCTHFIGFNNINAASSASDMAMNMIGFNRTYQYNRLYISHTGSIDDLKQLLTNIHPILYYALSEPEYEKITNSTLIEQLNALHAIKCFYKVNYFNVENNNLPIYLHIIYYTQNDVKLESVASTRIAGFVDNLEAVKQAIYHILMIERYSYDIYSSNYGVELNQYIGKGIEYLQASIEKTLQEALLMDLRIISVTVTDIEKLTNDTALVKFDVLSIYGNLQMEVNINV